MTNPKDPFIRALIFDLGGVLIEVDPWRGIRLLAPDVAERSEAEIFVWFTESDAARAYELGLITDEVFYHESLDALGGRYSFDRFHEAFTGIFKPNVPMIALLEPLAKWMPLYLLSNTNRMHIAHLVGRFSFFNLFRKAYYSHEIHLRKPDAAVYTHVLRDLGIAAETCLFIDDKLENVEAAFRCGFYACLYRGKTLVSCAPDFETRWPLEEWLSNLERSINMEHESCRPEPRARHRF